MIFISDRLLRVTEGDFFNDVDPDETPPLYTDRGPCKLAKYLYVTCGWDAMTTIGGRPTFLHRNVSRRVVSHRNPNLPSCEIDGVDCPEVVHIYKYNMDTKVWNRIAIEHKESKEYGYVCELVEE